MEIEVRIFCGRLFLILVLFLVGVWGSGCLLDLRSKRIDNSFIKRCDVLFVICCAVGVRYGNFLG